MALLSEAGDRGGAFPWVRMTELGLCCWDTCTAQSCAGFVLVLCSWMGTPWLTGRWCQAHARHWVTTEHSLHQSSVTGRAVGWFFSGEGMRKSLPGMMLWSSQPSQGNRTRRGKPVSECVSRRGWSSSSMELCQNFSFSPRWDFPNSLQIPSKADKNTHQRSRARW